MHDEQKKNAGQAKEECMTSKRRMRDEQKKNAG
jgi:hypothetical protein